MSAARKPLSKSVRFEVFKRDRFTCQYCGTKAPDVVLQVDHIHPVADGGEDDILNLVTACAGCNGGKGARRLDDTSVVERQRLQIEELEERRQQLEMILKWREGLQQIKADTANEIAKAIGARSAFYPNENGMKDVRRWLNKYSFEEVLMAVDKAFDTYHTDDSARTWGKAFSMIGRFLQIEKAAETDPHIKQILYIQGILRKRAGEPRMNCVDAVREIMAGGLSLDEMTEVAKRVDSWEDFDDACWKLAKEKGVA
jgi:hypothetical protein